MSHPSFVRTHDACRHSTTSQLLSTPHHRQFVCGCVCSVELVDRALVLTRISADARPKCQRIPCGFQLPSISLLVRHLVRHAQRSHLNSYYQTLRSDAVVTLLRACGPPLHPPSLPPMTAPQQSDGIERAPALAINSLRSCFEKLAADSSARPTDSLKPSTSLAHLTASPAPLSPRVRPLATAEQDRDVSESSSHYPHPASPSSNLRTLATRPPPPPPLRPSI